jgi:phage gp36-like protein
MTTPITTFITSGDLDTFLGTAEKTALTGAGMSTDRYTQTILDINSEVLGYVGVRPLASVPAALVQQACAMARYRLHKDNRSDAMQKDMDLALAFFKAVANGSWALPYVADPLEPDLNGGGVMFSANPSRFTGAIY